MMDKSFTADIIAKTLKIRDILINEYDSTENRIDPTLSPVPPFRGSGDIKLIIIGQDPTIRNAQSRKTISCTLNLDKKGALRTYIETICTGLNITLDNVYATNLFKYFYTVPPANTPQILVNHLQPNLELLKEELSQYSNCTIITLGEPVLQLFTDKTYKIRNYWKYKDTSFRNISASDNILDRQIYPFPHQPSLRKSLYKTFLPDYLAYIAQEQII